MCFRWQSVFFLAIMLFGKNGQRLPAKQALQREAPWQYFEFALWKVLCKHLKLTNAVLNLKLYMRNMQKIIAIFPSYQDIFFGKIECFHYNFLILLDFWKGFAEQRISLAVNASCTCIFMRLAKTYLQKDTISHQTEKTIMISSYQIRVYIRL